MKIPFYCFHDTDVVGDGSVFEIEKRLEKMVEYAREKQQASGVKLLWGTANVFGNPRYMNGAATNPNFSVVANVAVQVKNAIDATIALGGTNYVFWGGREGYMSLHNTDTKRELAHMGQFLRMARDYGRKQGFKGTFLIEPKPMEPTKHQYDYDSQTVIAFLKENGLENDFKLNIEVNHATLAGHTLLTIYGWLPMPVCWDPSMQTRATIKMVGIPTNSPPIFTKLPKPCSKSFRQVDLPTAGLTSMPKHAAIPPIWKIFLLHT
jgi:xylose isomerase